MARQAESVYTKSLPARQDLRENFLPRQARKSDVHEQKLFSSELDPLSCPDQHDESTYHQMRRLVRVPFRRSHMSAHLHAKKSALRAFLK